MGLYLYVVFVNMVYAEITCGGSRMLLAIICNLLALPMAMAAPQDISRHGSLVYYFELFKLEPTLPAQS